MFRNIYIEAYKNSIREDNSLEVMLCHVNHVYTAMGCILQDIEFMVANVISQTAKPDSKQRRSMPEKIETLTFNAPKLEFLPSSSLKYDYQSRSPINENTRSNNMKSAQANRQDSFDEMFPNGHKLKVDPKLMTQEPNKKTDHPVEQSQDDFMDYLFKNKNKG